METSAKEGGRLIYKEHDRISIPQDIPELGVEKGAEGVVKSLDYADNNVRASVVVTYSTNQPRGLVNVQLTPEEKVSSYTLV